jgi:CheY-like chemotaxis protein
MNMANPGRGRKRILMVEDHEDAWEMVALNLPEYKLTFARDFDEGLRLALRGYFDLYILDNWLPVVRDRVVPPHSGVRPAHSDIVLLGRRLPA